VSEPIIRFPVRCPQCANEALGEYALIDVAAALVSSKPLRLVSPCHSLEWDAGPAEIEQIREYLASIDWSATRRRL
jgi:hypothetical protein